MGTKMATAGNRISSNQVVLLNGAIMAAALLLAVYGSPSLASKFSQLPIKGFVNEIAPSVSVPDNPQALPGAMASPAQSTDPAEPDLALLDEIFVPAAPVVDDGAIKAVEAEQQLRNQLASVQLTGLATGGAFINGRFVQSGQPIGLLVSSPEGQPLEVFVQLRNNGALLVAGAYSHLLELKQ